VFERVLAALSDSGRITGAQMLKRLGDQLVGEEQAPYRFILVDEAQDLSVGRLRFLGALADAAPDSLFFAGDLGQRIYQQPFSWRALGVDIQGRSHTLRINYRTSHQIRRHLDQLLPSDLADVDGNRESRKGAISVFNGPDPQVRTFDDQGAEGSAVGAWVGERLESGMAPEAVAVFVRSDAEHSRAEAALRGAEVPFATMDGGLATTTGRVAIATMHLAKGLEFRAVAVMACDDDILPLQARIETVAEESELEEVYQTERHLLYVACTRAREELLVTGVEPASEFLEDLG
jgi:superfamily I DNA/RNA helicase